MADRCLQRPDCTSVTIRREQDFVPVLYPTTATKKSWSTTLAAARDFGKCLISGSYPGSVPQTEQLVCVGPLYHPSHQFLPTPAWPGSLTASLSQDSSVLRFLAGCSRVTGNTAQIVSKLLFQSGERENVYNVCERFRVSCPHHSTLEDSSPVTVSNINMSSRSYKHTVRENHLEVRW